MQPKLRLAYLTTRYPSLSHTFILREVAALRRRGVEVHTISMHGNPGDGEHLLSRENRDAAKSTYAVRPSRPRDVLSTHAGALARHPLAYLSTFREALSLARQGVKGRPLWQLFYFAEAIIVWQHCAKLDVRHIHAHHGSAPSDVALLAASFGRAAGIGPRTWSLTLHGPDELRDVRWFGLAEKVRRADAVACISDFARSQLMALVDERHWAKLRVVHCGVAPSEFARLEPPRTARPQVLCVGRLVAEKGHAVLLNAVALLVEGGHDIEVVIVGSGPLQTRLELLARDLSLTDRVLFRGALGQEDVRRCYATASLFCSASFAEGVPVVLMEAMACGRPVVATAIAGVRELVRDGETGLLVAPGDPGELSRAIASLLRDPDLGARLVNAARGHVSREYDVDRSAAELEELFATLLRPLDHRWQNSSRGGRQLATRTPSRPARTSAPSLIPAAALDPRHGPSRPEPARSR